MQQQIINVREYPVLSWILQKEQCDDKEAFNAYYEFFLGANTLLNMKEQELIKRLQIKFGQRMKGM